MIFAQARPQFCGPAVWCELFAVDFDFNVLYELCCFLIRTDKHINHEAENSYCRNEADDVEMSGESAAELVYHESNAIRKAALISDGEPCPLRTVHFTLDCADCSEARSAKKVENKERICGNTGECLSDCLIYGSFSAAIENAESTNNVFLCNKTCD